MALLNSGQADEAARELAEAVRLFPHSSKIHNNWGVALYSAGKFPDAARVFQAAIDLDPEFLDAYDNLSRAQLESGDPQAAIATAERARDIAHSAGQQAAADRIDAWLCAIRTRDGESSQANE